MSLPDYNEFASSTKDALESDFDTKYALTVNAEAPGGVGLSSSTTFSPGMAVLPSKLGLKWEHPSGFAIDDLQFSSCDKVTLESSLSKLTEGLKITFKGDQGANAASLGAAYKHKFATVTAEIDALRFSTISASALGGFNNFLVGGSVCLPLGGKFELSNYAAGVGWTGGNVSVAVQANEKFSAFNSSLQLKAKPNLTISAMVDYVPNAVDEAVGITIGGEFECCDNTSVKMKATQLGNINASITRDFSHNLTVTGVAGTSVKNLQAVDLGISATIG